MKNKFIVPAFLFFSCLGQLFGQGQYPITADIGYAASTNEISTHHSVPGYQPNSEGDPYSYQTTSGSYSVYYGNGNNNVIKKPIIIVEGFDATSQYAPDDIIRLLNGSPFTSSDNLADQLRSKGYDLIVLDFKDGGQLIQRNAFLLVKLIQHINSIKTTPCPIVVAGYSMGGIVARYALNYMESRSSTDAAFRHNVGLFFSFDSPQKGANIPLGMQNLVQALGGSGGILFSSSKDLRDLTRSMYSYAAQQMLIYHASTQYGEYPTVNSRHTFFFQQMKNLTGGDGYPRNCKKIAASLGSGTAAGQRYRLNYNDSYWYDHTSNGPSHNLAFDLSLTNNTPFIGYAIAAKGAPLAYKRNGSGPFGTMEIFAASALTSINNSSGYFNADIPADIMPGSFSPVFRSVIEAVANTNANYKLWIENACFIPTVSALDYNTSNWFHNISADPNIHSSTPFSSLYVGYANRNHVEPIAGNTDLVQWFLGEISSYENSLSCSNTGGCNFTDGQFMGTYLGKNVYTRIINGCRYVTNESPSNGPANIDWLRGLNWSGTWAVTPMTDAEIVSCFKNIGESCNDNGNNPGCGGYTFSNGQLLGTALGRNVYVKVIGSCNYITVDNPGNGPVAKDWLYILVDNGTYASNIPNFPKSVVDNCFKGENESCGGRQGSEGPLPGSNLQLLKLVPNPATDIVEAIISKDLVVKQVMVYDLQGRMLFQSGGARFNVHRLPEGSYLIRAVTQDGQNFSATLIRK